MAVDARLQPVELLRLVALVRARRIARLGTRLAVLALPSWLVVLAIGLASNTEESAAWNWFNDHGNRGFVVVLVVLALNLLVAVGVRFAGDAGAHAARFVPMVRRLPDPVIHDSGSRAGTRLLDLGGRRNRMPPGSRAAVLVLCLVLAAFTALGLLAGNKIHAQYRASHGSGGPVVTLGKDSHITRRTTDFNENTRTGNQYTYYISSPRGEASVEGNGKPGPGTKLTIIRADGGLRAVHVGGYSWVTSLVITVLCALLGCLTLFLLVRRLRAWAPDKRVVPLAGTLERLGAGRPVTVQPVPRRRPESAAHPVPLALTTTERTSDGIRRGALLAGSGVLALQLLGGMVAAFA